MDCECKKRKNAVKMKEVAKLYLGYKPDANGNPEFEHLEPADFGEAATQVITSFQNFVTSLGDGFGKLSAKTIAAIEDLDDNMKPIMTAVGMFVDSIIKTATMTIVTGYDENGKPIYERIDPDEFNNAGDVIVTQFSNFVEKLGDNFSRMKPSTVEAIEDLDDNMVPIMNSVSAFVDSIMKLATLYAIVSVIVIRGCPFS